MSMNIHETSNFQGTALDEAALRSQAPSIFAPGPMAGVSGRYTFVPTARIVDGLCGSRTGFRWLLRNDASATK